MTAWPWPAPADDGGARHLSAGVPLPDIALEATAGAPVNLAARQGAAVLFIYPFTGTPGAPNPPNWDDIAGAHGSTPEAEGFRDAYPDLRAIGYDVFALSGQTASDQRAFAARVALPFPILSDAGFAFADALRLPRFETGGVTYLRRITLIIRGGSIAHTIYPVHPPDCHAREVLALLRGSTFV